MQVFKRFYYKDYKLNGETYWKKNLEIFTLEMAKRFIEYLEN